MTSTERTIWETLVKLETAVGSMRTTGSRPDLLPLFAQLDELTAQLPRDTSPELLHYLHKKSYEKARLWLEGRDAENASGNCSH
jgi:hypothetical protein